MGWRVWCGLSIVCPRNIPVEMSHFLFVPPQLHSRASAALFRDEVAGLIRKVEEWLGSIISTVPCSSATADLA